MKKKQINTAVQPSAKAVCIEFIHATATKINIIGTFNGWRNDVTPMTHVGESRWIEVLLLSPGVYEYQFVVDGKWMPDPQAPKSVPNLFGEANSILTVPRRPN